MNDSKVLLDIRNLKCSFRAHKQSLQAVRGVDLDIRAGEILGLVGESGSGKSVTMKSIIGILPSSAERTAQRMCFDGVELTGLSEREYQKLRGNRISMIFQDPMTSLNPLKRVGDHLTEVLKRHRGMTGAQARREAVELMRQVGVPSPEERVRQYPHEFSGGMRQRVLIAMALAAKPEMLIADEPTTALDVTIQAQILELIQNLHQQNGMTVVLITHDLGVVASMCHRICVMYAGLIMELGATDQIFYAPGHPYTRALLRSIPPVDLEDEARLKPIDGQAPSIANPPPGCPFAPRCPEARPECSAALPEMRELSPGHWARCVYSMESEGYPR